MELKFIAWDGKKMIYNVWPTSKNTTGQWLLNDAETESRFVEGGGTRVAIFAFTGLKDKHGKEIYEGHNLKFYHLGEEKTGTVRYSKTQASFYIATKNMYGVGIAIMSAHFWYYESDSDNTQCEIIGHIMTEKE